MALSFDSISALTRRAYLPEAVDNIFKTSLTFDELKKNEETQDGGRTIVQPIIYAKGAAESYSGYATLDVTPVEEFTAAEFNWRQYHRSIVISRLDERKNSGKDQVLSLVRGKTMNAQRSLSDKLGDDLFASGGATAIDGLASIVSATSTYGGIAVADFSGWAAYVNTLSAALALNDVSTLITNTTIGGDRPSLLTTTYATYQKVRTLAQAQQRFSVSDEEEIGIGFRGVRFEGIPLVPDHKVPSGEMYALNFTWLHLRPDTETNFIQEDFVKPTNQDVRIAHWYAMLNITCSQRRQQGKITSITE